MEDYQVRPPRVLADQVAVLRINELGAARLKALHVGGLVQGDFLRQSRQHWLTRLKAKDDAQLLYKLMIASAERVHLYYPETDHEGKLNLPATVIPRLKGASAPQRAGPVRHAGTGFPWPGGSGSRPSDPRPDFGGRIECFPAQPFMLAARFSFSAHSCSACRRWKKSPWNCPL